MPAIRQFSQQSPKRPRFSSRLRTALRNSKIQWYQIPVGLGIGFLGLVQFYKVTTREREKQREAEAGAEPGALPKKRARIRPDGPW
jgi:phosphatidylserine decarboxylase